MNLADKIKSCCLGTEFEYQCHFHNLYRLIRNNLANFAPENMLDVGCADGKRSIEVADIFHLRPESVYGIDCNPYLIGVCAGRFHATVVDLELGSILIDDDGFSLVICNQVLEHLKNYAKLLDELIRVTKKGGYILIGIPNLAHLINRIYLLFGIQPMCIALDGPHVRSFTHRNFVKMLSSLPRVKLIDYEGSLMYPLPFFLGRLLALRCVGLSGYVCYLLQKK